MPSIASCNGTGSRPEGDLPILETPACVRRICSTNRRVLPFDVELGPPMSTDDNGLPARARARLGSVLHGKYRLDRVLGIGGMAAVYKATHRNAGEYAVKVLHPELSLDPELRERFRRE